MKSFVLFSYSQPYKGKKIRWGVLQSSRDTSKNVLSLSTMKSCYRKNDDKFKRSKTIETIKTTEGAKAFYKERKNWGIKIPFIGSLIERFLPS